MTESIKKQVMIVYVKYLSTSKKRFDTVNKSILVKKLQHYDVRGTALNWFKSYLSDRSQYVSVTGHISDHLKITCGVLQGSVLGPLLFLI